MKLIIHIIIFCLLTIVTQVGGIIYLISILVNKKPVKQKRLRLFGIFTGLYLIMTFLIVPMVAPIFGREKIKETKNLYAQSFIYKLANRNYVRPELNRTLGKIAKEFENEYDGIRLIYMDANFPFLDKFPLLPHLSHNDGKKIDVALIYKDFNGEITNKKPSLSGYGVFEKPINDEFNQSEFCKAKGYWQYNFPQYLTFGRINQKILFSEDGTRVLTNIILNQKEVGKLFIEPHLKNRMGINNEKVRFHGCRAVRHDDHIHFQLK